MENSVPAYVFCVGHWVSPIVAGCSDKDDQTSLSVSVLQELGLENPSADDVAVVREVAEMVCRRGAYLVSCGTYQSDWG